jgi:hypothetical protein
MNGIPLLVNQELSTILHFVWDFFIGRSAAAPGNTRFGTHTDEPDKILTGIP